MSLIEDETVFFLFVEAIFCRKNYLIRQNVTLSV